jgi:hypothetical protein
MGDFQMTIKASGRLVSILSVLLLSTGLFVCFAGPLPAAAGTEDNAAADPQSASADVDSAAAQPVAHHKRARHASRHWRRYAHHKSSGKVALKSSSAGKPDATDVAAEGDISTTIPPSVANANALLAAAGTPDGNARAMAARANGILQAAAEKPADAQPAAETQVPAPDQVPAADQVLAPDQLNDVDRKLPASAASAPAPAMTSADAPTQAMASADAPDQPAVATRDDSSTSDRTSLIGKIFMACGGVLTLASAVRMFMA